MRCFYEFSLPVLWFPCILFQLKLSSASPDGSALPFFFSFYKGLFELFFLRTTCKFVVMSLVEGVNGGRERVRWKRLQHGLDGREGETGEEKNKWVFGFSFFCIGKLVCE